MTSQLHGGTSSTEEDFLKSFVPTLFDSDSDAEDTFVAPSDADLATSLRLATPQKPLHVHLGKPMKKTTSSEAFSQVQSYYKRQSAEMELIIKEEQPEASSPSSQGNSNASTQTPFSVALDSSDSMDSSSPFYSVLSYDSADTVFELDPASFPEEPSAKRQKVESPAMLRQSPMSVSQPLNSPGSYNMKREASPASSMLTAQSVPSPPCLTPALMPRHSLPVHAQLPYNAGGVTTGIPVDSCPSDLARPWMGPQTMIPTNPPHSFYPGHYGSHIPATLPAPVTSFEKIAAALLEVKKAPLMASPLGLKLDRSKVASSLQAVGIAVKE